MGIDPATAPRATRSGTPTTADVVLAGRRGDATTARRALGSIDAKVREVALGALARSGALEDEMLAWAIRHDPAAGVRRRACDLCARGRRSGRVTSALRAALRDPDALVVESACWALGELYTGETRCEGTVARLSALTRDHEDARAREAAVAALGAIGHEAGLAAVLGALGDRPSVRRRAVVALAAFEGSEVADALARSASDRDWQVREVAEILLEPGGESGE